VNEEQRYERLEILRQQAAETLRLPPDAEKVALLAALRLSHETQVERLLAGATIDPHALLALSEAIEKLSPALPPPVITVEIVEPTDGPLVPHCRRCGWKPGDDTNMPPAPPVPPVIDAEPVKSSPAQAQNVVALPRRGGSIHDAVLPDGTPARMARSELWRYGAASDPASDWGAAHSLPPVPPECFPK
jgi:hypothetical protein